MKQNHFFKLYTPLSAALNLLLSCCNGPSANQDATTVNSPQTNPVKTEQAAIATQVEYAISDTRPDKSSTAWKALPADTANLVISDIGDQQRFWVRTKGLSLASDSAKWLLYGPLTGSNQLIDITSQAEKGTANVIQFATEKNSSESFRCCRIRVRVRVVTRMPRVVVRDPVPHITVRWRNSIPGITIKGPDVTISDLPKLPNFHPIPMDGSTANAGMLCEMRGNEAELSVQNGESTPIEVWINWKGIVLGPIRLEGKTMRSIGKTGYSDCKTALDNIFLTQSKHSY
jgi:hypothetical protein